MPRRASFAEVSRSVTKRTGKPELKRRATALPDKLRRKDSSKSLSNSNTPGPIPEEINEKETAKERAQPEESQNNTTTPEKPTEADATEKVDVDGNKESEQPAETVNLGEGEDNAEVVVLGEEPPAEGEEDAEKEEEEEEEKRTETEGQRKFGRHKRLSKKQLRLQQERLEEEEARAARRQRREERRRKKELQAELAAQEAPQTVDEAAFKQSIYQLVKSSLDLVMPQGEINITVDNLTPLMKGLELDTGDEDVKDVILEALLDSYGIIPPATIDGLILKKKMESNLDELEECVDTAFAIIDQDRDGIITTNDIYRLMIHLGEVLWDDQVAAILQAADMDGDGRISKKDLFLFLLGQEKTVKLEDQILNKYGGKEGAEDDAAAASTDPSPPDDPADSKERAEANKVETPAASSGTAALKAAVPTGSSLASERKRKMFTGYSQLVVATNRISENAPMSVQLEVNDVDRKVIAPGCLETDGEAEGKGPEEPEPEASSEKPSADGEAKTGTDIVPDPVTDSKHDQNQTENEQHDEQQDVFDQTIENSSREPTPGPHVNVGSSDWSDSGLVGSEQDGDWCAGESDEELQFGCTPLALEAGLCYLPAPEFNTVASPVSPRSPRSRQSSSSQLTTPVLNNESCAETPVQAEVSTGRQDALRAFNEDMDRLVLPDLATDAGDAQVSARSERTSEYDSEREGDEDSLPETSQQNLILKEIEKQVLLTKEALEAKSPSLGGVKLKERFAAMLNQDGGDGCESVVESEIHPVYVPPCARDARSGIRMPTIQTSEDRGNLGELDDGDDTTSLGGVSTCWRKSELDKEHRLGVDMLRVNEYATSTAEILSKGFASLSSPRSASSATTKPPSNDLADDVFSPLHDVTAPNFFPDVSDSFAFNQNQAYLNEYKGLGLTQEIMNEGELIATKEEEEHFNRQEPVWDEHKGVVVNGVPNDMRPSCERARKMSARRQAHAPLRRSLTCHLVTVKDLTDSFQSPTRGDTAVLTRRKSSLGPNSFMPNRRESPAGRRESSVSRRESSVSRRETSIVLPDSPASKRRQSLAPRRPSSMSRTDSPAGRRESTVSRVYSPPSRLESYRSQGIDSSRTNKDSSRSQKTSSRIWDSTYWDSARSQRDSSRSQKDSWRSQRDSHRSLRDSHRSRWEAAQSRADNSTGRSGERTDRSLQEADDDSVEMEEEFRFYGPNFDVIMSQKGEPEELLRESLYRDAIARSCGRRHTEYDIRLNTKGREGSPAPGESRKEMISRQLERVKEMELLIKQRRQNMDSHENDDNDFTAESSSKTQLFRDEHHKLHRSITAMNLGSRPSSGFDRDRAASSDMAGTLNGSGMGPRPRPKSCMAGSRTTLTSSPKAVTIVDAQDVHLPAQLGSEWSRHASPGRASKCQTRKEPEPKVHVVDLSSLLSDVNEPEPLGDKTSSDGERRQDKRFKPLAKMLVAYENARRRQASTAVRNNSDGSAKVTATSISRQLQQGIPYRPPTPNQDSGNGHGDGWLTHTPRKTNVRHRDNARPNSASFHTEIDAVNSAQIRHYHPNHSFVLSSEQPDRDEEQTVLLQTLLDRHSSEAVKRERDSHGARMTSSGAHPARENATSSVTFEFPERSVCVLKPRPAAVQPGDS